MRWLGTAEGCSRGGAHWRGLVGVHAWCGGKLARSSHVYIATAHIGRRAASPCFTCTYPTSLCTEEHRAPGPGAKPFRTTFSLFASSLQSPILPRGNSFLRLRRCLSSAMDWARWPRARRQGLVEVAEPMKLSSSRLQLPKPVPSSPCRPYTYASR